LLLISAVDRAAASSVRRWPCRDPLAFTVTSPFLVVSPGVVVIYDAAVLVDCAGVRPAAGERVPRRQRSEPAVRLRPRDERQRGRPRGLLALQRIPPVAALQHGRGRRQAGADVCPP
jgi:hypothetical protein